MFDARYDEGDEAVAEEGGPGPQQGPPQGPGQEETYYDAVKRELGMWLHGQVLLCWTKRWSYLFVLWQGSLF